MKSWKRKLIMFGPLLLSLLVVVAVYPKASPRRNSGADKTPSYGDTVDPYEVVPHWPLPIKEGLEWSRVGAVYVESANRIYILENGLVPSEWINQKDPDHPNWPRRGSQGVNPCGAQGTGACVPGGPVMYKDGKPIPGAMWKYIVIVVDGNGKLLESWDQWDDKFTEPHAVRINPYDPERHVWVVDAGSEQIFEFTHDGKKLIKTIGEFRVSGHDETHFGGPTDIAFLPNGDFYVSDGYQNDRVVKFSKDGKFLMQFGTKGDGP